MSLQVFLQAQLLGSETFLSSLHAKQDDANDLVGRCSWLTLMGEVVPRALLAELKLSRMLLGSSSAEQFLLVLAEEDIPRANEFLSRADNHHFPGFQRNSLRLVWASTENLGAWPVVRKRLEDALTAKISCPLPEDGANDLFAPFVESAPAESDSHFADFAVGLVSAVFGWLVGGKPAPSGLG